MSNASIQSESWPDVDSIRLPTSPATPPAVRKPRFRQGEKFLRGPIPWPWLSKAARLPGQALQVGLVLWHLDGFKKTGVVDLSRVPLEDFGVSRQAAYRGLKALEDADLVTAGRRRGRKTRVTILSLNPGAGDGS